MEPADSADELLAEINRRLPAEQHIRTDDPLYGAVILNNVVIDSSVRRLQQSLDESLHQLTAISEQQVDRAAAIAESLIAASGSQLERQVDVAARRWEERLKNATLDSEAHIRRVSALTWICAGIVLASTCGIIGSIVGNVLFKAMHR
jgi:hypothetical protein